MDSAEIHPQRQPEPPLSDLITINAASAAVRYLAEHGYDRTTAGELADAIGMSRSTFFRRFGSKEDVVFYEHELALPEMQRHFSHSEQPTPDVLATGILKVMHRLIRDGDGARLRSELLKHNSSLRERELVITHRYERVSAEYLERVAAPDTPAWVPVALAAALVAVHNAALRRWLRHSDPRAIGDLAGEVRALVARFSPWYASGGSTQNDSRVLVASFSSDSSPEEVLQSIAAQLKLTAETQLPQQFR